MKAQEIKKKIQRLSFSLVSWSELPPETMLRRGDVLRLAHGLGVLTQQVVATHMLVKQLRQLTGRDPSPEPADLWDRVMSIVSFHDLQKACSDALVLVDETLAQLAQISSIELAPRLSLDTSKRLGADRVIHLAEAVGSVYSNLGIKAVALSNSWARGFADSGSDVDIRLIVEAFPSLKARLEAIKTFQEGVVRQYDENSDLSADQFAVEHTRVDVQFIRVSDLSHALTQPIPTDGNPGLLEFIQTAVAVNDPQGILAHLKNALEESNATLGKEVAVTSAKTVLALTKEAHAVADGVEAKWLLSGPILEGLTRAVMGLGGKFHIYPKWIKQLLPKLDVCPQAAYERLMCVAGLDDAGVKERHNCAEELAREILLMTR